MCPARSSAVSVGVNPGQVKCQPKGEVQTDASEQNHEAPSSEHDYPFGRCCHFDDSETLKVPVPYNGPAVSSGGSSEA